MVAAVCNSVISFVVSDFKGSLPGSGGACAKVFKEKKTTEKRNKRYLSEVFFIED
jgi:hypothetical protein